MKVVYQLNKVCKKSAKRQKKSAKSLQNVEKSLQKVLQTQTLQTEADFWKSLHASAPLWKLFDYKSKQALQTKGNT